MEPMRYDPATWLPDPKLRALAAALPPMQQAALAESLTGNMSVHIAYCRRAAEPVVRADPMAETAVPVMREVPGAELVKSILPDGSAAVPVRRAARRGARCRRRRRPFCRRSTASGRSATWPRFSPSAAWAPKNSAAPGVRSLRRWSRSTACCWRRQKADAYPFAGAVTGGLTRSLRKLSTMPPTASTQAIAERHRHLPVTRIELEDNGRDRRAERLAGQAGEAQHAIRPARAMARRRTHDRAVIGRLEQAEAGPQMASRQQISQLAGWAGRAPSGQGRAHRRQGRCRPGAPPETGPTAARRWGPRS